MNGLIGLSDKTNLIKAWDQLISDGFSSLTDENMAIIWDIRKDKNTMKLFNIINIKNFITGSDQVGHWVLFYNHPDLSYYYDPYGIVAPTSFINFMGKDAIACNVRIDQHGGNSCGYYCLCEAYNIINKLKSDSYIIIRLSNGDIIGDIDKKIYDQHVKMLPLYYV